MPILGEGAVKSVPYRALRTLVSGWQTIIDNADASPSNESVAYGVGATAVYKNNEFKNNVVDGIMFVQNLGNNIDATLPLLVDLSFYVKGNVGGDVNITVDSYIVEDGYVYDGTNIPLTTDATTTVVATADNVRATTRNEIDITGYSGDNALLIVIKRDATTGNTKDTVEAPIIGTNIKVSGYVWS